MVRESTSRQKMLPKVTKHMRKQHLHLSSDFARTLLYNQVPKNYTWNNRNKTRQHLKQGQVVPEQEVIRSNDYLGPVYTVLPTNSEYFHMRLLLHEVRGPIHL
ncbi:hypothetical protein AVEN_110685-1 [Araneus ventricosus]|uniref:Helitron helicase-like domain-containing protein n=1 Tax=Araneus ventricosus TaxID=182803 RepID=A0A4Y2AW37_ARAVE|nr:hypothetical protein AVEN_110685-1 [Araneus ventricosus]